VSCHLLVFLFRYISIALDVNRRFRSTYFCEYTTRESDVTYKEYSIFWGTWRTSSTCICADAYVNIKLKIWRSKRESRICAHKQHHSSITWEIDRPDKSDVSRNLVCIDTILDRSNTALYEENFDVNGFCIVDNVHRACLYICVCVFVFELG